MKIISKETKGSFILNIFQIISYFLISCFQPFKYCKVNIFLHLQVILRFRYCSQRHEVKHFLSVVMVNCFHGIFRLVCHSGYKWSFQLKTLFIRKYFRHQKYFSLCRAIFKISQKNHFLFHVSFDFEQELGTFFF